MKFKKIDENISLLWQNYFCTERIMNKRMTNRKKQKQKNKTR